MVSLLAAFYLSVLFVFALVTNPVIYCFLLLSCALLGGLLVYVVLGFSWYLALFYIVYVGGVYVLYIFVSVQSPNVSSYNSVNKGVIWLVFLFFLCLSVYSGFMAIPVEQSVYLVSFWERLGYCYFCAVLVVGFFLVSMVGVDKSSFHR